MSNPQFVRGSAELAIVYVAQRNDDAALDALRSAIAANPKLLVVRKMYALQLTTLRRNEGAITAWQDALNLAPEDRDANSAVANLLVQEKQYAAALPYLETLAKTDGSSGIQIRLGSAYLKAGQTEKGAATLQKVLDVDTKPMELNDIAYELADADVSLPKALELAQRAVEEQEKQSHNVELSNLLKEDLECTRRIGYVWDTLGWTEFRLGHFEDAENYLNAAWTLMQDAVVAEHLGEVYERENENDKAAHMYRLALAGSGSHSADLDETKPRLKRLDRTEGKPLASKGVVPAFDGSGDELSQLRTVKLKQLIPETASAEFFLLFGPGAEKLEDVAFISGSEKLKLAADSLYDADFRVVFPTGSSARLVRRAIVMCSPISGCNAVFYTPGTVHSVN